MDTLTVSYERALEHPLEEAFAWLTDYRDDDPERTDAVVEGRKVVEDRGNEILVEADLEILWREITGLARIELRPPDAWSARIENEEGRPVGRYDYRLEEHPGGCKLEVDYNVVTPRLRDKLRFWAIKPLVRREIDEMWAGFEAAMDRELAGEAPA